MHVKTLLGDVRAMICCLGVINVSQHILNMSIYSLTLYYCGKVGHWELTIKVLPFLFFFLQLPLIFTIDLHSFHNVQPGVSHSRIPSSNTFLHKFLVVRIINRWLYIQMCYTFIHTWIYHVSVHDYYADINSSSLSSFTFKFGR